MKLSRDTYLLLAVLGVAGWFIWRGFSAISEKAQKALASTQSALADGFFRLLGPAEKFGPNLFYTVTFPNGARHAIPSDTVSSDFLFTYTVPPLATTRWRMLLGQDNKRYAAPA